MDNLLEKAKDFERDIIEDRRHLHGNPEVGFNLPETAEYVKSRLREMGIEPKDCGGNNLGINQQAIVLAHAIGYGPF
ncbi:MAG TPA: hypothetical protein VFD79_04465 [Tissierellaceae bacterium]|nr:hypothetical protein [Tissierellaceae bacterium]